MDIPVVNQLKQVWADVKVKQWVSEEIEKAKLDSQIAVLGIASAALAEKIEDLKQQRAALD